MFRISFPSRTPWSAFSQPAGPSRGCISNPVSQPSSPRPLDRQGRGGNRARRTNFSPRGSPSAKSRSIRTDTVITNEYLKNAGYYDDGVCREFRVLDQTTAGAVISYIRENSPPFVFRNDRCGVIGDFRSDTNYSSRGLDSCSKRATLSLLRLPGQSFSGTTSPTIPSQDKARFIFAASWESIIDRIATEL